MSGLKRDPYAPWFHIAEVNAQYALDVSSPITNLEINKDSSDHARYDSRISRISRIQPQWSKDTVIRHTIDTSYNTGGITTCYELRGRSGEDIEMLEYEYT